MGNKIEAQKSFSKWLPLVLNFLGPPHSKTTALYLELGLKRRDNEELRRDFFVYVQDFVRESGLEIELKANAYPFE